MSANLSALFLFALIISTATRLWLATRQIRHVSAHRDTVPAAFADAIPLESHRRAADYTIARVRLGRLDVIAGALLTFIFTLGGGLQWLFDLAARAFAPGSHAHGLLFIAAVIWVNWAAELPFALTRTFGIEARFGFNKTTWRLYLADTLKSALLAVVVGGPLLLAVLWLMGKMGAGWWLHVWLFWCAFNLLALLIYPTFIAPLFNKFTPLEDAPLKARIEALLARCGFRASGVFVMDGSRRSSHGNAYFTGFGRAKRIVFFDTLITRLDADEIEAVLAHELGHYHHHHIWKRIAFMFATSFGFMWVLGQLASQPWFFQGLGMHSIGTAPALMLFLIALPVFLFPLSPLMSMWSRRHEFEADAFARREASGGHLVSALVKLYRDNAATLTPDPLYSSWYDSHPNAATRIARLRAAAAA